MKNGKILGSLSGLLANIIFGFSFLFSKIALETGAHPLIILSIRFVVAFLILNILWALGLVKIELKGKPIKKLLLMAFCQPVVYFICELYGIDMVSSAVSGVIIGMVPAFVMLASAIFLKEKPTVLQVIFSAGSFLCIGIISYVSRNDREFSFLGLVLLLGAVISAAAFNLLSRSTANKVSPASRTYVMFAVGTAVFSLLPIFVLKGDYLPQLITAISNPTLWIAVIYLAGISSVAAFLLYNYCTGKIGLVRASSFSNIITVISVPAGIVFLKEELSVLQILLCALIIICVYLVNKFERKVN